jgi:hypothetical protein
MQAKNTVNERILGIFLHKTDMGSSSCCAKFHAMMTWWMQKVIHNTHEKNVVHTRIRHTGLYIGLCIGLCAVRVRTPRFSHVGFDQHRMPRWMAEPTTKKCIQKRSILHSPVVQKSIYVGWNRRFWILPDVGLKVVFFWCVDFGMSRWMEEPPPWHAKKTTCTAHVLRTQPYSTYSAYIGLCTHYACCTSRFCHVVFLTYHVDVKSTW